MSFITPTKVAIVGTGKIGSTFAYAMLLRGLASEIVLIDKDAAKAEGEALDLQHTIPFSHHAEIRASNLLDAAGADINRGLCGRTSETRPVVLRCFGPQYRHH